MYVESSSLETQAKMMLCHSFVSHVVVLIFLILNRLEILKYALSVFAMAFSQDIQCFISKLFPYEKIHTIFCFPVLPYLIFLPSA